MSIYSSFLEKALKTKRLRKAALNRQRKLENLLILWLSYIIKLKQNLVLMIIDIISLLPRHLTAWVLGLLRYDLASEDLLDVVSYEAQRLFRDRLVDEQSEGKFDSMLNSLIKSRWSKAPDIKDQYFTSLMNASSVGGGGWSKRKKKAKATMI